MSGQKHNMLNLERELYVLQYQKKGNGKWETQGLAITGQTLAEQILERTRAEEPGRKWRVILRSEAMRYLEGWNGHEAFASGRLPEEVGG